MKIDFTREEITKILKDKFGDAEFRVFYVESVKHWEAINNKKMSELQTPPKMEEYVLYFD